MLYCYGRAGPVACPVVASTLPTPHHYRPLCCARRHSSASHAAQAGGGAYLMLYNYCTAEVERLFVAGSPDLATWWVATRPLRSCTV